MSYGVTGVTLVIIIALLLISIAVALVSLALLHCAVLAFTPLAELEERRNE